MQKINLRDLYPDIYKTDIFLEVTDEVHAVFLADKRADAAYERQMYRYKAYYIRLEEPERQSVGRPADVKIIVNPAA